MNGTVMGAPNRAAANSMLAPLVLAALAFSLAGVAAAKPVTVADLLADSPAGDWRAPTPRTRCTWISRADES
jgi:hypothetical protein